MLQKLQKDDTLCFYIIALLSLRGAWFVLLYVLQNKLVWLSQQPNQVMSFSPRGQSPCNSKATTADNEGKDVEG